VKHIFHLNLLPNGWLVFARAAHFHDNQPNPYPFVFNAAVFSSNPFVSIGPAFIIAVLNSHQRIFKGLNGNVRLSNNFAAGLGQRCNRCFGKTVTEIRQRIDICGFFFLGERAIVILTRNGLKIRKTAALITLNLEIFLNSSLS